MENNKNINSTKGAIALMPIIIVILLVIGAGAAYIYINKSPADKINEEGETAGENSSAENIGDASGIEVSVPELNFSASPLGDLEVSSLNVSVAQISTSNIFSAPTVDSDFSFSSDVNIPMPAPAIDFQMPSIPTNISGGVNIPSGAPSAPPDVIPTASPASIGQPQTDCSVFSSVPSCSYTGAPGSQGYEACKQCYPNK